MTAEQFAEGVGGDIVDFHGKDQVEQITVGALGVGQECQVAEHPADVKKTKDGQGDGLKLAFGAVRRMGISMMTAMT